MERKRIWVIILGLIIITCAGLTIRLITIPEWRTWIKVVDFDPFTLPEAIDYPHAKEIKHGTARSEVKRLLGAPQEKTNSRLEFWVYRWTGWQHELRIKFDTQGNVRQYSWEPG